MNAPAIDPDPAAFPLEPTWEVAHLYPAQGTWSEEEYLALPTNRLVEYSQGFLEVLPVPTSTHQWIALLLYRLLEAFVSSHRLGFVLAAPVSIRLWPGKFRQPDVLFMHRDHASRIGNQFWDGADLVMEVISPDHRRHDVETKRREYAQAGIPEYWIIDPQRQQVLVLRLDGQGYVEHGTFGPGERSTSCLLPGFAVDTAALFVPQGFGERPT